MSQNYVNKTIMDKTKQSTGGSINLGGLVSSNGVTSIQPNIKYLFAYWFGDIVYLRTDSEQLRRIVTGITLRSGSSIDSAPCISYELSIGGEHSWHFWYEISKEVDVVVKTQ